MAGSADRSPGTTRILRIGEVTPRDLPGLARASGGEVGPNNYFFKGAAQNRIVYPGGDHLDFEEPISTGRSARYHAAELAGGIYFGGEAALVIRTDSAILVREPREMALDPGIVVTFLTLMPGDMDLRKITMMGGRVTVRDLDMSKVRDIESAVQFMSQPSQRALGSGS